MVLINTFNQGAGYTDAPNRNQFFFKVLGLFQIPLLMYWQNILIWDRQGFIAIPVAETANALQGIFFYKGKMGPLV